MMLKPGTLWVSLTKQTEQALQCGALQPIPTEYEFIEQDGISFLVRILANLSRKDKEKKKQEQQNTSLAKEFNPFLPYEEDLFVADISKTHLCVLNKFNVVDHHLLIITRAFEEQENWLNLQDFAALGACMAEFEGLAFYNGGRIAGASQRHKHLQLIPLNLVPEQEKIPIEEAIASAILYDCIGIMPSFPFIHAIAKLDLDCFQSPLKASQMMLECYYNLLRAVELQVKGKRQSVAYNLLVTREWMLIVVRSQECFQSISVNSLGFAGALLVRNQQQMKIIKDYGPINILRSVAKS